MLFLKILLPASSTRAIFWGPDGVCRVAGRKSGRRGCRCCRLPGLFIKMERPFQGTLASEAEAGSRRVYLFLDAETTQFSKLGCVPAVSGAGQGPGDRELGEPQMLPLKFRVQQSGFR